MTIELNLSQAEGLLTLLHNSNKDVIKEKTELMSQLKTSIKFETENQNNQIDTLINKLSKYELVNVQLINQLKSSKSLIDEESHRIKDKYFDSKGNEKNLK